MNEHRLLEPVSTIVISATTGKFVAKEKFAVNTRYNTLVKISRHSEKFFEWFLSRSGKIEGPISEQTLRCHELRLPSVSGPIIAELGGEVKAETTLSEMLALMKKHAKGKDGTLLVKGYYNIFYIKDVDGVLRVVSMHWFDCGWFIDANSVVDDVYGWGSGSRVFSRLSVR